MEQCFVQQLQDNIFGMGAVDYKKYTSAFKQALIGLDNNIMVKNKKGSIYTLGSVIGKDDVQNTVIYTIGQDLVSEEHYISDGVQRDGVNFKPIMNERLLNPDSHTLKRNIIDSIKSSVLLNEEYHYKWVNNTLLCVNKQGEPVDIDSIQQDDFYTLKLLELLMQKGIHKGVLVLQQKGLTKSVQDNLKRIIELLCVDYMIFEVIS